MRKFRKEEEVHFISRHYLDHPTGFIYRVSIVSSEYGLVELRMERLQRDEVPVEHREKVSKGVW